MGPPAPEARAGPLGTERRRITVAALACLFGAACVVVALISGTSYFTRSAWYALDFAGGCAFIVAGAIAAGRERSVVPPLMIATGTAVFVRPLLDSENAALFTFATATHLLYVAFLAHLLLAFPAGALSGRLARVVTVGAYIEAGVLQVVRVLGFGLATGERCSTCPEPVTLFAAPGLSATILLVQLVVVVPTAIAGVVVLVRAWRRGSPALRRRMQPVVWTGMAYAVVFAGFTACAVLALNGPEIYLQVTFHVLFALIPAGFLAGLFRARVVHAGVLERLIGRLPELAGPEELQAALADALGDPSLRLTFTDAQPPPGRAAAPILIDGRQVGTIVHDAAVAEPGLGEAAGRAAALWLDHMRLQAELRDTMARMVDATDAERRRIERDLHDGTQQRLLGIRLALRLALERSGDRTLLEEVDQELDSALHELRALAHGLHPAVLEDEGLAAALDTLARRSALPLRIRAVPEERLPPAVERCLYFVTCEALANAIKHAQATVLELEVLRMGDVASLEIADDGVGGADLARGTGLVGLQDRVEALHGTLLIASPAGAGTQLRLEVPCG